MEISNYLIDFLQKIDVLVSEINKLESKTRLCQKNAKIFGFKVESRFSISPEYFVKLREFVQMKIEHGSVYEKEIVELKRNFLKEFNYIITGISKEISRIDIEQQQELNRVVRLAIYNAELDNEINIRDSFNVKSSIFDNFLGVAKYRSLSYENHNLKIKKIEKKFNFEIEENKNAFELVNLIENLDVKTGELLCLQDDIIKYFMIDKNTVKRSASRSWKPVELLPKGIFNIKNYYKILNKNLKIENEKLQNQLDKKVEMRLVTRDSGVERLALINSKLAKIIKNNLAVEYKF